MRQPSLRPFLPADLRGWSIAALTIAVCALDGSPALGRMVQLGTMRVVAFNGPVPGPEPVPDDEVLEGERARIGRVIVRVGDVFDEEDPGEDKPLFRWVNSLHIKTRSRVIREDLLFAEGDFYSRRLLEESERILRTRDYLHDAEIEPVRYRDGEVDVEVRPRDVWTITGGLGFGRSGGENDISFSIHDENFLGTGKEFGIKHASGVDRTTSQVAFREDTLFGTRLNVELTLSFNSDGERYLLDLEEPFYALDARRSRGLTILTEERIDPLFDRGQLISEIGHKIELYEGFWGFSGGLRSGSVHRWRFGFTFDRDRFFAVPGAPEPAEIPVERSFARPWVDYEWLQDRFVEMKDLDKIARTEDINLGTRFHARLGWASTQWGASDDLAIISLALSKGFRVGRRALLFNQNLLGMRTGSENLDSLGVASRLQLYWRNLGDNLFYAEVQADLVDNLDAERQLLIGGDSGLRGYPLRFEEGNRRFLVTLEQRFFTGWEAFKLADVGAAVFFDVGEAWFHGARGEDEFGVLKDVGVGLRLSPSRSSGNTVIHLDVAFPLDGDRTIESVQWLVTTKATL